MCPNAVFCQDKDFFSKRSLKPESDWIDFLNKYTEKSLGITIARTICVSINNHVKEDHIMVGWSMSWLDLPKIHFRIHQCWVWGSLEPANNASVNYWVRVMGLEWLRRHLQFKGCWFIFNACGLVCWFINSFAACFQWPQDSARTFSPCKRPGIHSAWHSSPKKLQYAGYRGALIYCKRISEAWH